MANPKGTAQIAGHPFHPMLVVFPIAFFVGTLITEIVYSATADAFWARVSFWLLIAGLEMGAIAALAGFADFFGDRLIRATSTAWLMIGNVTAVVLSLVNFWLRYRYGATADYPPVLWFSLAIVPIFVVTGWHGGELVLKHRVGVAEEYPPSR